MKPSLSSAIFTRRSRQRSESRVSEHEAIFGKDNGLKQDSFDNNTPSSYITIDKDNSEKTSYTENINDIPSTVIIRDSQPRVNKDNNYASYEIHDKYPEEEVKTIISRNPYQERPQTPQNIQEQKEEPSTYITRNYNNDRNEVKKVEDDAPATIIVRGDPIVNVSSTASSENIDDKSIEVKEDHSQSQENTTNVNPGVISFDDLRRKSEVYKYADSFPPQASVLALLSSFVIH